MLEKAKEYKFIFIGFFILTIFTHVSFAIQNYPIIDDQIYQKLRNESKVRVIVMLKDESNLTLENSQSKLEILQRKKEIFDRMQREILVNLFQEDFEVTNRFSTINGFSGKISTSGLEKLIKNNKVLSIYLDREGKRALGETVSFINADDVWKVQINNINITGGSGKTTVCIIDSGVNYTHSNLGGCFGSGCKVVDGYDFFHGDSDPIDTTGHGTRVAGVVTSNGTIKGVAPDSKIVAIQDGDATPVESHTTSGVDWCLNNATLFNISVITISTVYDYNESDNCFPTRALSVAIKNAFESGIFVDAASGNDGFTNKIGFPSCSNGTVSVGATYDKNDMSVTWTSPDPDCTDNPTKVDQIACGTNRAKILDLIAPGSMINTTNLNGNYIEVFGTSFSAPHIAGVAALMLQAANLSGISLTPVQIESIMKRTGKPVYDHATKLTFPRIDAYSSVMAVLSDVFVSDLSAIHSNLTGRHIFEFSIFNDRNSNVTVTWNLNTGDGTVINGTQTVTLGSYNGTLVYAEYLYTNPGTYTVNASVTAQGTGITTKSQAITITVDKYNLKAKNLSVLNSTGLKRIFEFRIENNSTLGISDVYWKLNATGESEVSSVIPINMAKNETAFVYVEYQYANAGSHNVTAMADPNNAYTEQNETDNTITISDP